MNAVHVLKLVHRHFSDTTWRKIKVEYDDGTWRIDLGGYHRNKESIRLIESNGFVWWNPGDLNEQMSPVAVQTRAILMRELQEYWQTVQETQRLFAEFTPKLA